MSPRPRVPFAPAVGVACLLGALLTAPPAVGQVTELPQTVAPGRVLLRVDGLRVSLDRRDGAGNVYDALGVASTTLRAGLTRAVDLQVGLDFFLRESIETRGSRDSDSGVGDVSFRVKWAFWRDEPAGAAAAVMPYVRLPTGSGGVGTDAVEGGLMVPWAITTPGGFKAGAMAQWDLQRNDAANGYDSRWFVSGFALRELTRTVAVYGETTAEVSSAGFSTSAASVGAGALWRFARHVVFDYELQRGLGRRAAAWTHTWRVNWEW